jgi:hypothetical protein
VGRRCATRSECNHPQIGRLRRRERHPPRTASVSLVLAAPPVRRGSTRTARKDERSLRFPTETVLGAASRIHFDVLIVALSDRQPDRFSLGRSVVADASTAARSVTQLLPTDSKPQLQMITT